MALCLQVDTLSRAAVHFFDDEIAAVSTHFAFAAIVRPIGFA